MGLLLLAWSLRVARLGAVPAGLAVDEAHNGLDAFHVVAGLRPLFFLADNGREPLFIYSAAPFIALIGPTPFALRLAGACWGLAVVAATFAAARVVAGPGRRTALAAAAAVATAFWPAAASRLGLEAMVLPVVMALAVIAYRRSLRRPSWRSAIAAGAMAAAGAYAHPAGRVAVLVPLADQAMAWLSARAAARQAAKVARPSADTWPGRAWLGFGLGWLLAVAPLGLFFGRNPGAFWSRLDRVAIFGAKSGGGLYVDAGRLIENVAHSLALFAWRGDNQWSQNIPGQPLFQGVWALGWLVGAGAIVWKLARSRLRPADARLLALWLLVMLLPASLSGSGRDFARAGGALPAAALIAGVGVSLVAGWLARLWRALPTPGAADAAANGQTADAAERRTADARDAADATDRRTADALALIIVVAAGLLGAAATWTRYVAYVDRPETAAIFSAQRTAQGLRLATLARDSDVYVTSALFDRAIPRFLTSGKTVGKLDAASGISLPGDSRRPAVFAAPADGEDAEQLIILQQLWLPRATARTLSGSDGTPLLQATSVDPGSPAARGDELGAARIGWPLVNGVELVAARVETPAPGQDSLPVDLVWQATEVLTADLTVFVHLRDGAGRTIAQADGLPVGGLAPTRGWRPGAIILDRHVARLAEETFHGRVSIYVGLYDPQTGRREADGLGANERLVGEVELP